MTRNAKRCGRCEEDGVLTEHGEATREAVARTEVVVALDWRRRGSADAVRLPGRGRDHQRTHRGERRARADIEALVETSPVGVVVLDARAGRPVSFNREARRIVESLRTAGRPAEQLLEVVSVRRADGREVSLAEIPLEQQLGAGETVRAEEVVLSVPDGRCAKRSVPGSRTPARPDTAGFARSNPQLHLSYRAT